MLEEADRLDPLHHLRSQMEAEARAAEQAGHGVVTLCTAFPKNPPPPGIAYSKNFARFQKDGLFATQER